MSDGWKQGYIGRAECAPKPLPTSRDMAERIASIWDRDWEVDDPEITATQAVIDAYVDVRVAKERKEALTYTRDHLPRDSSYWWMHILNEAESSLAQARAALEKFDG